MILYTCDRCGKEDVDFSNFYLLKTKRCVSPFDNIQEEEKEYNALLCSACQIFIQTQIENHTFF